MPVRSSPHVYDAFGIGRPVRIPHSIIVEIPSVLERVSVQGRTTRIRRAVPPNLRLPHRGRRQPPPEVWSAAVEWSSCCPQGWPSATRERIATVLIVSRDINPVPAVRERQGRRELRGCIEGVIQKDSRYAVSPAVEGYGPADDDMDIRPGVKLIIAIAGDRKGPRPSCLRCLRHPRQAHNCSRRPSTPHPSSVLPAPGSQPGLIGMKAIICVLPEVPQMVARSVPAGRLGLARQEDETEDRQNHTCAWDKLRGAAVHFSSSLLLSPHQHRRDTISVGGLCRSQEAVYEDASFTVLSHVLYPEYMQACINCQEENPNSGALQRMQVNWGSR